MRESTQIDFIVEADGKPVLAVEVELNETRLSRTLKNRRKWFPDYPILGVQVVDQRNVFQKHP